MGRGSLSRPPFSSQPLNSLRTTSPKPMAIITLSHNLNLLFKFPAGSKLSTYIHLDVHLLLNLSKIGLTNLPPATLQSLFFFLGILPVTQDRNREDILGQQVLLILPSHHPLGFHPNSGLAFSIWTKAIIFSLAFESPNVFKQPE